MRKRRLFQHEIRGRVVGTFAAAMFLFLVRSSLANVVGSDAQNFNPITSGIDFVTVHSSETLEPGVFNLGLFANYAKNTFPYYYSNGASQTRSESNDSLTGGDLNLGVGVAKNWDAGLSLPVILNQQIGDTQSTGHYSTTGNTEVRVNTKYRFAGDQNHGYALIASANFNRIKDNPYLGSGGGPIYNLELAGDSNVGQFALAANIGYRWRNPGSSVASSGIAPLQNQYLLSAALNYYISIIDTKVIIEVVGAFPEKSSPGGATDRETSVTEALIGAKHDFKSGLSFHAGAGTALQKGISSPDFRVYTGINFSFGPLFGQKPLQADPYYERDKLVRFQQKKRARVKRPKPKVENESEEEESQAIAKAESEEVKPPVKVETVRQVKVFDRGQYNHIVINSLQFAQGSSELLPESERYLQNDLLPVLRELNRRRPIGTIIVEGHTDSLGAPEFNQALSRERARMVADHLLKKLDLKILIRSNGLGSDSPIADNGNYQGRALNNRVEFKLFYQRTTR